MAEVWERSQHSGTHLLMLLAIADFADDDGRAYPAVASLAKKCRMKPRNVQTILATLRNSGELVIRLGEGPKGTNLYRIPPLQGIAPLQDSAPLQGIARGGAKACANPLQGIAPKPSVNHQEPSTRAQNRAGEGDAAFAECWQSYPKREGGNSKTEALKAYRARIKAGVPPEDLLSGVKRYAAYNRATGKEGTAYVKQASTFFGPGDHWKEPWAVADPGGGLASAVATDYRQDPVFKGSI